MHLAPVSAAPDVFECKSHPSVDAVGEGLLEGWSNAKDCKFHALVSNMLNNATDTGDKKCALFKDFQALLSGIRDEGTSLFEVHTAVCGEEVDHNPGMTINVDKQADLKVHAGRLPCVLLQYDTQFEDCPDLNGMVRNIGNSETSCTWMSVVPVKSLLEATGKLYPSGHKFGPENVSKWGEYGKSGYLNNILCSPDKSEFLRLVQSALDAAKPNKQPFMYETYSVEISDGLYLTLKSSAVQPQLPGGLTPGFIMQGETRICSIGLDNQPNGTGIVKFVPSGSGIVAIHGMKQAQKDDDEHRGLLHKAHIMLMGDQVMDSEPPVKRQMR
jgi:hypothetical protein